MSLIEGKHNYIELIFNWIQDNNSTDEVDFTQPHIKRSLRYVYPLFIFLHALTCTFGFIGNVAIIIVVGKHGLYKDQVFFFICNIALSDILKCVFVLPITLANLLIQNWVFGSFMCFFLPMLQCFPIHASMLTYLVMAIDRYRLIVLPFKSRAPAGLCIIGVWVAAVCIVLPFAVYIKYIDLGAILGFRFSGVGLCYLSHERDIEEYIRAMFVTLYAMPLAVICFLCVKVSAEIKSMETVSLSVHYSAPKDLISEHSDHLSSSRLYLETTETDTLQTDNEPSVDSRSMTHMPKEYHPVIVSSTSDSDDELDLPKEKRTQNYLISMVTLFAFSWLPLNILILVQYFVHENGDNSDHFDVTYITFTLFGFLSTCFNPVLFTFWRMSDSTKDRLRGYFRFSSRNRSASEAV